MHPMTKIVQWNCKGQRARHEEVRFLMNRHQPSCIVLKKLMLDINKYNLGREYEFYATTPLSGEAREELQLQLIGKGKKTVCSIYLPPQTR